MTILERLLNKMTKPIAFICVVLVITLSYFYLDKPIAQYFHDHQGSEEGKYLFQKITDLGNNELYLILFLVLALLFRYVYRSKYWEVRSWFLWLCVLFPIVICGALKVLLGRARPGLLFLKEHLYGFYGPHLNHDFWSFPSGHTTTVMGVVFGLSVVFPRYFYLFLLSGSLVIFSRVMLLNHFLSDVLAASYLALIEVGFLLWLKNKKYLRLVAF